MASRWVGMAISGGPIAECNSAMLLAFADRDDRQTTRCEALATVLAWMSPVAPCRLRQRALSQGSSRGIYLFWWFILSVTPGCLLARQQIIIDGAVGAALWRGAETFTRSGAALVNRGPGITRLHCWFPPAFSGVHPLSCLCP